MHPMTQRLIDEYLEAAGHFDDQKGIRKRIGEQHQYQPRSTAGRH